MPQVRGELLPYTPMDIGGYDYGRAQRCGGHP